MAALGPDGHPVSRGVRRGGDVGHRVLHLHRGTGADRSRRSRCRSPRTTGCARRTSRCSAPRPRSAATSCRSPPARGSAPGGSPSRRPVRTRRASGRTAVRDGDGWVINGTKTFITHGQHRRRDGGDGGDRQAARAHRGISAFIVERGNPGMAAGPQGRQARHARERHERGDLPRLPRAGRRAARRRARGLHQHAAGARRGPHRHRGPGGGTGAGRVRDRAPLRARARRSSGSPSRRSRRSSGNSWIWPRASRRRAC